MEIIQAAGAVLWRKNKEGEIEVAIIHRPRYLDWSLPKGKLEKNESHIACAYREVLEETGVAAIFGPEIGDVTYRVGNEEKVVRYWSAQAKAEPYGKPDPGEVDEVLWLSPKAAKQKLTLQDDREVVDYFLEFGTDTFPLVMLRHAKALKRDEWDGDDGDRPLDQLGQRQIKRLSANFLPYGLAEIHSSDAMRCLETVAPLSEITGVATVVAQDLSEYGYAKDKEMAYRYIQELLEKQLPTLICSHNPVIPKLVKKLIGKKNFKEFDEKLEPSEAWILHIRKGKIIAVDLLQAPIF